MTLFEKYKEQSEADIEEQRAQQHQALDQLGKEHAAKLQEMLDLQEEFNQKSSDFNYISDTYYRLKRDNDNLKTQTEEAVQILEAKIAS
jgi:hypothetical protein